LTPQGICPQTYTTKIFYYLTRSVRKKKIQTLSCNLKQKIANLLIKFLQWWNSKSSYARFTRLKLQTVMIKNYPNLLYTQKTYWILIIALKSTLHPY